MINTREEFLADTLKYYCEDTNRININTVTVQCKYYPVHNNTEGCAIGRHLNKKSCIELDKLASSGIKAINNVNYEEYIPKWMRDFGREFLVDIQTLHDAARNWKYSKLSGHGKNTIKDIIKKYNLDESKLKEVKHFYETSIDESSLVETT